MGNTCKPMAVSFQCMTKSTTNKKIKIKKIKKKLKKKKHTILYLKWSSLVSQMVKNLPAMQEAWVQSLGQKDPLEKGMTTHSSILAGRIPWTKELGGLQSMGS